MLVLLRMARTGHTELGSGLIRIGQFDLADSGLVRGYCELVHPPHPLVTCRPSATAPFLRSKA